MIDRANFRYLLSLWCLLGIINIGFAQNLLLSPNKKLSQFILDNWTNEQGLPSNTLNCLLQTQEGYIWIGTYDGLVRFDGVRFTTFDRQNTPIFNSNTFVSMAELPDGTLLVGSEGSGLITYKDGKFGVIKLKGEQTKRIDCITRLRSGKILLGTRGHGVYEVVGNELKFYQDSQSPIANKSVKVILEDTKGGIWLGTEGDGLFYQKDNQLQTITTPANVNIQSILDLHLDKKGTLWIATGTGLFTLKDNVFEELKLFSGMAVNDIAEDSLYDLWFSTYRGLYRYQRNKETFEILDETNGLANKIIKSVIFDKEGSLWLASYRVGLYRLKDGKFTNYTTLDGLGANLVNEVYEIAPKKFLVACDTKDLFFLENNTITKLPYQFSKTLNHTRVRCLYEDSRDNLWVGTDIGVIKVYPNGKEELFDTNKGLPDDRVYQIGEDTQGNIVMATRTAGLVKLLPNGKFVSLKKNKGFISNFIMSFQAYQPNEWLVCTNDAGLCIIKADSSLQQFSTKEGLVSNLVFNALVDGDKIWVVTNGGLSCVVKNKCVNINPLRTAIYDVLADDKGYLWLPTSKGVIRVAKEQLNNYLQDTTRTVDYQLLGKGDGMKQEQCLGATLGLKDSEGHLWFLTTGGIAKIDPHNMLINQLIPQVKIEEVTVDNVRVEYKNQVLEFPAGSQRYIFHFTALSFVAPQKVFFKYKLEGLDKDWIDAGTERSAVYTNLSPATYRLRVKACNNDGVWNEVGATIQFKQLPYFYQTLWFYMVCIIATLASIYFYFSWRTRIIQQRNEQLEKTVKERTAEILQAKEEIEAQRDRIYEQRQELEVAYQDSQTLGDIGQKITAQLSKDDLLAILSQHIGKLMEADLFGIGVYDDKTDVFAYKNYFATDNEKVIYEEPCDTSQFLSAVALKQKTTIVINNFGEEGHLYLTNPDTEKHLVSGIFQPLIIENRPLGILVVQAKKMGAYSQRDVTMLQTLATYVAIGLDNAKAYDIIQLKNNQITDSLRYASTIQTAVLPSEERMKQIFQEYFIISLPKDIVSGDFYWAYQGESYSHLAVVDCTGHGVPGAFMSMIGNILLTEIVRVKETVLPSQILLELHELVRGVLKQEETGNTDGMDICMVALKNNDDHVELIFSGAKRPLYVIKQNQLQELQGDRKSIGGMSSKIKNFTDHHLTLSKGDCLYLCSDGYADQCNPQRTRFGSLRLKELLSAYYQDSITVQKEVLLDALKNHQQKEMQRDDITLVGVRL